MPNCETCSADGSACTKCSSGLFRTASVYGGALNQCSSCTSNRFYELNNLVLDGTGECKYCREGIPNCEICYIDANAPVSECLWCASGKFLFKASVGDSVNNQCVDCNDNTVIQLSSGRAFKQKVLIWDYKLFLFSKVFARDVLSDSATAKSATRQNARNAQAATSCS